MQNKKTCLNMSYSLRVKKNPRFSLMPLVSVSVYSHHTFSLRMHLFLCHPV